MHKKQYAKKYSQNICVDSVKFLKFTYTGSIIKNYILLNESKKIK